MPDYLQTANDEIATIVLVEKARGREARRARAVTTSGAGQVTDPVCGMRIDPAVPLTHPSPGRGAGSSLRFGRGHATPCDEMFGEHDGGAVGVRRRYVRHHDVSIPLRAAIPCGGHNDSFRG